VSEVDWLAEWRRKRAEAKNKYVPLSAPDFGVTQVRSIEEVFSYENANRPVAYLLVGGSFRQRQDVTDALQSVQIRLVTETEAEKQSRPSTGVTYDHWPTFTTLAHKCVRSGISVALDGNLIRSRIQSLAEGLFANGARAVIAIDPTTMYEESWREDGVTGVYWTKW